MSPRPSVKRVFVSSTAEDLVEHRESVVAAIERFEQSAVQMKAFGARPGKPLTECCALARSADVLVVIVAHRYGWIPGPDEDGDGLKSITRWEVEAAHKEGVPVFAFLVDESYAWTERKEQDRLTDSAVRGDPARVAEVLAAINGLQDFKDWLGSGFVRDTFTTADHLASRVATALGRHWLGERVAADSGESLLDAYRASLRRRHDRLPSLFKQEASLHEVFVELDVSRSEPGAESRTGHSDLVGRNLQLRDLLKRGASDTAAPRWVVLGDPGAGKSTVSRHLVWELAHGDEPIPVYSRLSVLASEQCHPFKWAEKELVAGVGSQGEGLEAFLFARASTPGAVWLFLDGLDEVHSGKRGWVGERLTEWSAELKGVTICVLSRAVGYERPGRAYENRARIARLNDVQQSALLEHWLGDSGRVRAVQRALANSPGLREACSVPLMLALMAYLQRTAAESAEPVDLPANKLALYRKGIHTLLDRGQEDAPGVENAESAYSVLSEVCLALQAVENDGWTLKQLVQTVRQLQREEGTETSDVFEDGTWRDPHAFFRDIARSSGVLAQRDRSEPSWTFLHRQFRELLAAEALHAKGDAAVLSRARALEPEEVPRWAEVLGFACTMADDSLEILRALGEVNHDLALRVLPEVEGVDGIAGLNLLRELRKSDPDEEQDDWDGDFLVDLIERWIRQGQMEPEAARGWLLGQVQAGRPVLLLSYLYYALEHLAEKHAVHPVAREAFFQTCELWPSGPMPSLEWVPIPPGSFVMGSPDDEPERYDLEGPQHEVQVRAFMLTSTAITNGQYQQFDAEHIPEAFRGGVSIEDASSHPVVNVSWWEAYLYSRWLGVRLPSEAEWEYAARAGTETPFSFGKQITTSQVNYNGHYPYAGGPQGEYRGRTVAVRSLPGNAFGLYEMHGNTYEWVQDRWHDDYEGAPTDGLPWLDGGASERVLRGGSWVDGARYARAACRFGFEPGSRNDYLGFRLARGPVPEAAERREEEG